MYQKRIINSFLSCLLLIAGLMPLHLSSQEEKPKVALVLSGGGAKGLAHIPTLQALDSLGIVPDLIVGNSMGSIVGALYAAGYSGDSIAKIAKDAKWNELMGGSVSLKDVSVEEKTEFGRYLIELDWKDGRLKPGSFLLNDQNLRAFIASVTFPVYNISQFDSLPIPFRAVATDIVNGKEVIFDSGSISFAIRASMSIPGVFSAVPYEETLLVDGGVLNNFPVDIAKNMGADIIIGSDVGGGMVTKDKLENIGTLLFQAGMLSSNLKNPSNRALCDILVDHTAMLTYSTGDFSKANEIYEEGKIAVKQNLDKLIALSERLKNYQQRPHELPYIKDEFVLDTIVYTGISKNNLKLVKARTDIHPNRPYSRKELIDGINRAMGTTIFSQITYNPITENDKLGLQLNGFERSKHQIKGSLHYDGDHGVGLIVNYTGRNIIGNASRSLIAIDVADQPKFRLQHQKNFGNDRDWWWRSEVFFQQLKQKVFVNGEYVDDMRYRHVNFDNQINRNLGSLKSYVGIGLKYQNINLRPTIDPEFNDNIFKLEKYNFNDTELYTHYQYNSMNKIFFATRGTLLHGFLGRPIQNNVEVESSDITIPNIKGSTNGFTKFGIDYEKRFRLTASSTAIWGASANFIFEDKLHVDDVSFMDFGLGAKYFLGGNIINPRNEAHVFHGLNEGELNVSQFVKMNLGLQINAMNKIYVTPHLDVASVGFGKFTDYIGDAFSSYGKWQDSTQPSILMSVGTTFSYDSILGPINFDLSWVNGTDKMRFFIGIGYHFNRSN